MEMRIKANPEKAQKILKTNRVLKVGDKFSGTFTELSQVANKCADTFELLGQEVKKAKEKFGPKSNKKLKKSNKFKSK